MNLRILHNKLISSRLSIPTAIILAFLLRIVAGTAWNNFTVWALLLLQIGIAISFMQINHTFTIIQKRTMLPTFFFLLFSGTNPYTYDDISGNIICAGMLLCIIFMLGTYQIPTSQGYSFNIAFLLTLCSIFWPPLILFFPIFWFNLFQFQSLNIKTFVASLIGIGSVLLTLVIWSLYQTNNFQLVQNYFIEIKDLFQLHPVKISGLAWLYIGFIFILMMISRINSYIAKSAEKIRTNTFLRSLYLFAVVTFIFFFLLNKWNDKWLLVAYLPASVLISHYFTLSTNKFANYLLFFTIAFFLCIFFLAI